MVFLFISIFAASSILAIEERDDTVINQSEASICNEHPIAKWDSTQQGSLRNLFAPLLESMQASIDTYVTKLTESQKIKEPFANVVPIEDDLRHLRNMWLGLPSNSNGKHVALYCEKIFNTTKKELKATSTEDLKRSVLKDGLERIGQAVFLAERCLNEMPMLINPASFTQSNMQIRLRCMKEITKTLSECAAFVEVQKEAGLQDPCQCERIHKAHVMARILLTNHGQLNLGMIPFVRSAFIPKHSPQNDQLGLACILSTMNSSWQPTIDAITKPSNGNSASHEIIRADLGLSRKVKLNDFHSKWTALKALFSQFGQGTAKDCFTKAWSLKKHEEYFVQSLKEYGELLKYGYLMRIVDGYPDRFYFNNILSDEDLRRSFSLDPSGMLNEKIMVWQVPNLIAAARQMGIDNIQEVARTAIDRLFQSGYDPIQTNPAEMIRCFADLMNSKNTATDYEKRSIQGNYGFSLTQNHLLQAWETTLASIAEANNTDSIHHRLHAAVAHALQNQWNTLKTTPSREERSLVIPMQKTFEEQLHQQSRCVYNAGIPLNPISADGRSTIGGFELYKRLLNQPYAIGQRIATPDEFREYLIEIAHLSSTILRQTFYVDTEKAFIEQITSRIIHSMQQDNFLQEVFLAYDYTNAQWPDPVANYRQLPRTPMTTLNDNTPYALETIEDVVSFLPHRKMIAPSNPYSLIKWMLDLAKWKEQTERYLQDFDLDKLEPSTNWHEPLMITFENQDIKAFVHSNETSDQWLHDKIIQPNLSIIQAPVDDSFKKIFSKYFIEWVQQNTESSASALNELDAMIAQINRKEMTLQVYASNFFHLLDDLLQADGYAKQQLAVAFDALFLQTIPPCLLEQLAEYSVRFAKVQTSLERNNPLYFCVFLNPRTAVLSFGTLAEDRTHLSILDEYEWMDQL